MRIPDYLGGGLVNLAAELEQRLTGRSPSPALHPHLASRIPDADSYVLVLIDGLGDHQLGHPDAVPLRDSRVAALDASFSTQTTVNTSTLATGLPPSQHGVISYQLRLGTRVLNTIYWFTEDGTTSLEDPTRFLPSPNLAERLAAARCRVVATEPSAFVGSPLDRMLFRGATVQGTTSDAEGIELALGASRMPGTLVLLYLPHVDAAAHAAGQESDLYADAIRQIAETWERLISSLPNGVAVVGTADHGHVDIAARNRIALPHSETLIFSGDNRVVYVSGSPAEAISLAESLPATWVPVEDAEGLWGPAPLHEEFAERLPDGLLFADEGYALVPAGTVDEMVGHHGGVTEAELRVPILVSGSGT
jgi:hypothetical protein